MKRFTAIGFLILFLGMMLRPAVPYLGYQLNKTWIATNLCVNRDKPQKKCNGKCHLKKQVKQQTREEAPAIPGHRVLIREVLLDQPPVEFTLLFHQHAFQYPESQSLFHTQPFSKDIFHPPRNLV